MPRQQVSSDLRWARVRAKILGRTAFAIRARIEGTLVWLPRSTIENNGDAADDAMDAPGAEFMPVVDLAVVEWKAREHGWA